MNKSLLYIGGLTSLLTFSTCGMFQTKKGGEKIGQNSSALAASWELKCSKFNFLDLRA